MRVKWLDSTFYDVKHPRTVKFVEVRDIIAQNVFDYAGL